LCSEAEINHYHCCNFNLTHTIFTLNGHERQEKDILKKVKGNEINFEKDLRKKTFQNAIIKIHVLVSEVFCKLRHTYSIRNSDHVIRDQPGLDPIISTNICEGSLDS